MPVRLVGEAFFVTHIRGFKYGTMSSPPISPAIRFRRNSYGQFRDMLEQAPDAALVLHSPPAAGSNPSVSVQPAPSEFELFPPIQVRFLSRIRNKDVSPETTNSQNLSIFATSSLPYIDGELTERFDVLPDHRDDITISEAIDMVFDS